MALDLPPEIQNDFKLFNLNEQLKAYRADLANAVSKIESGSFSIKKIFAGVYDNLKNTTATLINLVEGIVIPKDRFTDFTNGDATLDEFGSFDMIQYYNELQKLYLMWDGIKSGLQSLQESPQKPVAPTNATDQGVLDVLDTREFIEQGYDNPVFDAPETFNYYTIKQYDTLQSIAAKVYNGDSNRWTEIGQANNLSDSDLLDNDLVGRVIKIPTGAPSSNNVKSQNMVFESFFNGTDQKSIDRYNYGRDIDLFDKKFIIDASNDIKLMEGVPGVVANIQDRFDNLKGSLNPSESDWGILPILDTREVPFPIFLDRLISDMEGQASSDPRVINATANRSTLRLIGDRMDVEMTISLIGGRSERQTFSAGGIV